jgi:hypothetical protein
VVVAGVLPVLLLLLLLLLVANHDEPAVVAPSIRLGSFSLSF